MAENDSLARFATDLPKLLMQYKLAMAQMGSDEDHEMAMLRAKMGYESSSKAGDRSYQETMIQKGWDQQKKVRDAERLADKKDAKLIVKERQKALDVIAVIDTELQSVEAKSTAGEKRIIELQDAIRKTSLQIDGLGAKMPSIPDSDKTVDGYTLAKEIEDMANTPRKMILESAIEDYNEIQNTDAQLTEKRNELDKVLTDLTSLQIVGERHVASNLAGDPTLTQSDDYAEYFKEVLTKQYGDDGVAISDDLLPGNSDRFEPGDSTTEYYKEVFVNTFSPTDEEVAKQSNINRAAYQQQLSNYSAFSVQANTMLTSVKTTQMASIYKTNSKGKTDVSMGFNEDSAAYQNATAYIQSKIQNPTTDEVDKHILTAMNISDVSKGSTFIENLNRDESGFLRGILDAMGSKAGIDEIEAQVKLASSMFSPNIISTPTTGFYNQNQPPEISPAAQQAIDSIFK